MLWDIDLPKHNVSRETFEKLSLYNAFLKRWNKAINLVSPSTIDESWTRHIKDSAQIFGLMARNVNTLADLGSGGGFPGLVVAILAAESRPNLKVTLVESDQRKATFLREVARVTEIDCTVMPVRIETVSPLRADVVSARALAPLSKLLDMASRHVAEGGRCILMKGSGTEVEIQEAQRMWSFDFERHVSLTDGSAAILVVENIKRL